MYNVNSTLEFIETVACADYFKSHHNYNRTLSLKKNIAGRYLLIVTVFRLINNGKIAVLSI